jgi:hypothetical protein
MLRIMPFLQLRVRSAFWIPDTLCGLLRPGFTVSLLTCYKCFGAASAKDRLDTMIRNAINAGEIPGPRYLANAWEIAKPDGDLVASITSFADSPEGQCDLCSDLYQTLIYDISTEMRQIIRRNIEVIGIDNIKLSMSGEEIIETRSA